MEATGVARKQVKPTETDMATLLSISASLDLGSHAELIELLPIAAYAVRAPDGVIAWFNSRATEIWGRVPVVGDTDERFCGAHKLFYPDGTYMAHCDTPVAIALKTGASVHEQEVVIERPDCSRVIVSVHIDPIRDSNGSIVGAVNFFSDITQQKQSEKALRESENRLRTLTDTLEAQVRIRTEQLVQRNTEVLRQSEQLRDLSHRMRQIQDEERRRIARELHDSAGQLLTVLGMDLSTLVRDAQEKAPEIAKSAEQARELVYQLTSEIRTTSYLLHPPLLDEEGLQAAISLYVRGLTERSGLDITFNICEGFGRLPRDMELAVFRLVQECLTNVHRHSGSKIAAIHMLREESGILLEVEDAGSGISHEKLLEIQSHGAGVGIRGMRERVLLCGGEMKIESEGHGTKISITLPT